MDRPTFAAAALACLLPSLGHAAPSPATSGPQSFVLHPELEISLFASEPEVLDPVSVSVDERGRVYVAEMRDYPYGLGADHAVGGVIRWLEDRDGDGRADHSGIFAEGIRFPTSVAVCRGGVLVTAAPDILFLKDADGDGRAEVREVVLTGFKLGVTDSNLNGLRRGLDNWYHVVNGGNGGRVSSPKRPGREPVSLGDRDLRFRPDTGEFELTSHTGGGFGLVFDEWGRSFTPHNVNHMQQRVADADDFLRIPGMPPVETTHSISDHGEMARIFAVSEAVTRPNHPEQAGHFSSSGGMGYLGHRGWPKSLRGGVLVCDVVGNLVHRDVMSPDGPILRASRAPEEQTSEWIASRDRECRPVGLEPEPGGGMYLIDMQRAVIEHPDYIPKKLLETLDIRAGETRGRIYTVRPRGWKATSGGRDAGKLPGAGGWEDWVRQLGSEDAWVRGTAQRLLVERGARDAVPRLERLVLGREPGVPEGELADLARLHAAWALEGLGALPASAVESLLEASHPQLRENAIELARGHLGEAGIREKLRRSLASEDAGVRFRAALVLSHLTTGGATVGEVVEYWERSHDHVWGRRGGLVLAGGRSLAVLEAWLARGGARGWTEARAEAVQDLSSLAAAAGGGLDDLLNVAVRDGLADAARQAVLEGALAGWTRRGGALEVTAAGRALLEGLERAPAASVRRAAWAVAARAGLPESPALRQALGQAAREALDPALGMEARLAAVELLGLGRLEETSATLLSLLDGAQPGVLQQAAFGTLRDHREPVVAKGLLTAWPGLAPALRPAVVNLLVYRHAFHGALLEALEKGSIQVGELNLDLEHRRELLRKASADIRQRAARFTSDEEYSNRRAVVEEWMAKLPRTGDATKGRLVFEQLCASCHRAEGLGHPVGPELTRQNHRSVEDLLSNILDPNMAMNPAYVSFTAEMVDGESETGVLSAETPSGVTLLQALGRKVDIPRQRLKQLRSNGKSLMPEGLEAGLTPATLRDLIAFVQEGTGRSGGGAP